MVDILHLTPDEVAEEIPVSLLPSACGAVSAKSYRDKEVRPLVWLIFGGTGALGRQVSKVAIGRHDKVMIAALDEEYDCGEWEISDDESEHQVIDGDKDENASGTHNDNNKRPSSSPDQATTSSRQKRPKIASKVPLPSPFLYIGKQFRGSCKRVRCDVRIKSSVDDAIQKCLKEFGKIDVAVNCFGYGVVGACEDQIDSEVRSQFEVNFMGLFHTLRAVLPYLTNDARNKTGDSITPGHIISFTSSMGVLGAPGFGPYSATRWAAEGLLESFAIEVEHTGCKVTIIETGYAKSGTPEDKISVARPTGMFGLSNTKISSHFVMKSLSKDYQNTPAEYGMQFTKHLDKILATSTIKVAKIIWEIGHCQSPPLRLLLGSCGVLGMKDKLRGMAEEIEDWKFLYEDQEKIRK